MAKIGKVTVESHLPEAEALVARAKLQWGHIVGGLLVNLTHRDAPSRRNPSLSGRGTPVDTGYLRNSMAYALGGERPVTIDGTQAYSDDDGNQHGAYKGVAPRDSAGKTTVYVGSNVVYALKIEEGGQGYGGQRMCRNAVMDAKADAQKALEDVLKANEM